MITNPNKDHEIPSSSSPSDGVSSLRWSPAGANHLVAGSWDSHLRCWEVPSCSEDSVDIRPKCAIKCPAPVLSTCWTNDGTSVLAGGCDNKAYVWNLDTQQLNKIAQHDAPVRSVFWVEELQVVVTGSWDRTIKYWDPRTPPHPVCTVTLPERLYSMDVRYPMVVVGTAERYVLIFDMKHPQTEIKRTLSPLKYQTRVVTCLPDRSGFALGAVEGRVAIHHTVGDEKDTANRSFSFKAHRHGADVYSVNSVEFHPAYGTVATTGSDGSYAFWDIHSRLRLKDHPRAYQPISASAFNRNGSIFAYAVSYDWSQGSSSHTSNPHHILLHHVTDADSKPRPPRSKK